MGVAYYVPITSTIIFHVAGSNYHINPTKKEQPTQALATISLDELKEITRNFSYDTLIGQGSHSEVFLGELKDSRKCVVKILEYPDVEELDNEFLLKVMSAYSTLSTILDMAFFI